MSEPHEGPRQVRIEFGVLARPFRKQLRAQRIHVRINGGREIDQCQKDSEALNHLTIRRVITERQRDAGRVKILKAILKQCFVLPSPTEEPDHG